MSDKPIIFSAPMIRALLDGRKTQTRRILKNQETWTRVEDIVKRFPRQKAGVPYTIGNRLWVRETWQDYCPLWHGHWCGHGTQEGIARDHQPVYRADPPEEHRRGPASKEGAPIKWRSPIHMPRWASRLTLIVKDVKVERLQDIGREDAIAEGCELFVPGHGWITRADLAEGYSNFLDPRLGFETIWTEINGPGSWGTNPWVVALTFEVMRSNIDALPAGAPHV